MTDTDHNNDTPTSYLQMIDELNTEVLKLRDIVADYEYRMNWGTTCAACAKVLDSSIELTARVEDAEARLAAFEASMTTPRDTSRALRNRITQILLREGAGEPEQGIHSWRCQYPDRYGPCNCVQVVAEIIAEEIGALTRTETDGKDEWCQHCSGPIIPGEHRQVIEGDLACERCIALYHKAEPLSAE